MPNGVRELRRYFEAADGRSSFHAMQKKFFAKQREEDAKRDRIEDQAEADLVAFATSAAIATEVQIRQFSLKLDTYETATVEALIANQEALDLVQARLDAMLERAYVVEDGRRVFKTRDGTQVFDEFGEEVGRDIIAPEDIDDSHPFWEDFEPSFMERQQLLEEREQIIDYQERLDDARADIEDGEISAAELEELDAELAGLMPPAVQMHVPGMTPEQAAAPMVEGRVLPPQTPDALDL